jgi:hypothetical protein
MSSNSLEKTYNKLAFSLWTDLIFYYTEKMLVEEKINDLDIDISNYLGKFLITNFDNGFSIDDVIKDSTKILNKGNILSKNMFELLSIKSSLKTHEFDYILEKYHTVAEYHFYITDWLVKNLDKKMSNKVDKTMSGLFKIQLSISKNHFEELIKHFYPTKDLIPKGIFNIMEMIKELFPNLLEKFSISDAQSASVTVKIDVAKDKKANIKVDKPTKKKPLITNEEADIYLLENIFNVRVPK